MDYFLPLKNCSFPGHSIRAFLAGKRKPYFKPIAFVFLLSTVYALTNHFIGKNTYMEDFVSGMSEGVSDTNDIPNIAKVLNWMASYHAYTTLLLLPIFSLASYMSFDKSKYNYFEHLILNAYIIGQQALIYAVFSTLLYKLDDDHFLIGLPFLLAVFFNFWTFFQFFTDKKPRTKIFLTFLTYFFYLALLLVSLAIIGGVGKLFE